jgi:hypothetical protein
MANVTFGPESGASPAPVLERTETHETPVQGVTVESTTYVAPSQPATQALAVRNNNTAIAPAGMVLGDKIPEMKEIILPRLNIVQNIGDLKDTFAPGSLVYDQKVELFVPPVIKDGEVKKAGSPPVSLIVLGFRPTRYVEKVEGGGRGMIVDSEDAVRANGGTLDYNEWKSKKAAGMKRFECLAEALIAIQRPAHLVAKGSKPEDPDPVFTYDIDELIKGTPGPRKFALGLWGLKGTSYTVAKRAFFTARAMGCLKRGGYPSYVFAITSKEESYPGGNKAWVPVCIPTGPTDETLLEFVRQVLHS